MRTPAVCRLIAYSWDAHLFYSTSASWEISTMVLTNFECWAHGDPATAANFETGAHRPAIDPFNPRAVTHLPAAFVTDADANNNNSINSGPPMQEVVMPMVVRCKKRLLPNGPTGGNVGDANHPMYTKRCRYDDADLAAQYCNGMYGVTFICFTFVKVMI